MRFHEHKLGNSSSGPRRGSKTTQIISKMILGGATIMKERHRIFSMLEINNRTEFVKENGRSPTCKGATAHKSSKGSKVFRRCKTGQ